MIARRAVAIAIPMLMVMAPADGSPSGGAGLWDVRTLQELPAAQWGAREGQVQEVYYAGEPRHGRPTRIFAYLGRPAAQAGNSKHPAMLLLHGGGGRAFSAWADHWAQRGYVALAIDLGGKGPERRPLPDGGPPLDAAHIFLRLFDDDDARNGWPYHAVAAALRGHSLLASLPEVDAARIGITGISWGGFATCIVAGLDDRLKVAVPVYGSGFLHRNSTWKSEHLDPMTAAEHARWVAFYDPSSYLTGVGCPILFLTGPNDRHYPIDSHRASFLLVRRELRQLAVIPRMKHGHIWTFPEVDRFVDQVLRGGPPLPGIKTMIAQDGTVQAETTGNSATAQLVSTGGTGPWTERTWKSTPATLRDGVVSASLPPERPLAFFISVSDAAGVRATTPYEEIGPP
jgi:dienelactone hydrolase